MKTTLREYSYQGLKYGLTGGIGFAVSTSLLYILTEYVGIRSVISAGIAYIANMSTKFILHKFWTFQSKEIRAVYKETLKYVAARILFFTTNIAFFWVLVELLHIHYMVASVSITVVLAIPNFLITRWIFCENLTLNRF